MSLTAPRFAGINSIKDAATSFSDLQIFLDQLMLKLASINMPPAAGGISVLTLDDTGTLQQYTLVAGAGVTITRDDTAKTWTVSSP